MLKVNIDQGRDYLEYLRPFILQVLIDHDPSPVTDEVTKQYLQTDFGLDIPSRTVQIILKRISRSDPLQKSEGAYYITGQLFNPMIASEKANAARHIQSIVSGLIGFRTADTSQRMSEDEAVQALCEFLSEFSIPCLRAYLRGTAIPDIPEKRHSNIVLVSQYVFHLQANDPERFSSFMVLVQGHMLANGLLCPDLQNAPKSYRGVTFYLDTPLMVRQLGLEEEEKKKAIQELITLLRNLGGTVAALSHSIEELDRVIKGAAEHLDDPLSRGAIITEARRNGTTKSDLLLLAGRIDELLEDAGIEVRNTPRWIKDLQIDEKAFEQALDDEVSYFNPRAKQYDINSVRSIYVLRAGRSPRSLEKCQAVLVTSNSAFSHAAYEYGKNNEDTREVSSVITDFSLANLAWLKAPMGAPSLPAAEVLAYAYAALHPSRELLEKYLHEIDRLEKVGEITPRDHQLLRSTIVAQEELMKLTLGDEVALTAETVRETLARVTNEIKKEESERLRQEQAAHRHTKELLERTAGEKAALKQRLFWKCRRRARACAWGVSTVISLFCWLVSSQVPGSRPRCRCWGGVS